jgi:hypothetical protein
MILICKTCGHMEKSLLIPKEKALQDLITKLQKHIATRHQIEMEAYIASFSAGCRALDSALTFKKLIGIPPGEDFVQGVAGGAEQMILDALGINVSDIESEETPNVLLESNVKGE